MPYARNADLPSSVKDAMPSSAGQTLFRTVFNSQNRSGKTEEVSFASAWAALKRAGYKKDDSTGEWSLMQKASSADGYVPPKAVQDNARRALAVREEKPASQRGMTPVGIARARDLSNGKALSLDTVQRMKAYFDRHEVDKKGATWSEQGKGWQAWMGWGGDEGRAWAEKVIASVAKSYLSGAISASSGRTLYLNQDNTAAIPFPYDPSSLASLNEDQKPRFYAALTDFQQLPTVSISISDLNAMQDRIDPAKVQRIIDSGDIEEGGGKPPVVVRLRDGKMYIADGHHRVCAAWLSGLNSIDCYFKDLLPYSNALKAAPFSVSADIVKSDNEQQVVYGWASIVEKDGQPVIDTEGDVISIDDLEKAALAYVMKCRVASINHTGDQVGSLVESIVFTKEKQKSLGIDLGKVGWWVGYKITDPSIWQRIKSGELQSFSIGGSATRTEI
jgi:cation transport regulator ChaB